MESIFFMKKRFGVFAILLSFCLLFFGCQDSQNALSVTITDVTSAGSTDATIKVDYQEEEEYKDKYADILIKSDCDNQKLKLALELDVYCCIKLEEKDKFYSLTKLIANAKIVKTEYEKYDKIHAKTYIFGSKNDVNLKFVAIVGDLDENTDTLINTLVVSKKLDMEVKKSNN